MPKHEDDDLFDEDEDTTEEDDASDETESEEDSEDEGTSEGTDEEFAGDEESDDDDEEDDDNEQSEDAESEEEEDEVSSQVEPGNKFAKLRATAIPDKSLFQQGLEAMSEDGGIKAEAISLGTLDIVKYAQIFTSLQEMAKTMFVQWQHVKQAKKWEDLAVDVMKDFNALTTHFKLDIPEATVDFILNATLAELDHWYPIGNLQAAVGKIGKASVQEAPELDVETAASFLEEKGHKVLTPERWGKIKPVWMKHRAQQKKNRKNRDED